MPQPRESPGSKAHVCLEQLGPPHHPAPRAAPSTSRAASHLWSTPPEGLIFHDFSRTHSTVLAAAGFRGSKPSHTRQCLKPLRYICKVNELKLSLVPWSRTGARVFRKEHRSTVESHPSRLSDSTPPARPQWSSRSRHSSQRSGKRRVTYL